MLKFKLDQEAFGKLSEAEKTFYAQAGDGYQLQVEGATDKSKLDEFRQTNVELMKQQEQFKGIDVEKYRKLEEQERKLRDKELIEKGEFEQLVQERTAALENDYQAKLNNMQAQLDETTNKYTTTVSKYEIEGAASKAFAEHKIAPEATEAVLAQIRSRFVVDNGQVIAKEGDTILTGADGNLTVSEFVASQPEIFKIQSNGGAGQGNKGNEPMQQGRSSQDRIKSGLAARMSKN
jgi:hypothetical protein